MVGRFGIYLLAWLSHFLSFCGLGWGYCYPQVPFIYNQ